MIVIKHLFERYGLTLQFTAHKSPFKCYMTFLSRFQAYCQLRVHIDNQANETRRRSIDDR